MRMMMLVLLPCLVLAQPPQSENFRIAKSVIDAGGAASSSTDFRLTSVLGQPSPLGWQSSSDFRLSGGFLAPMLAISPLSPIQDLVIQYAMPNAILRWGRISGARSYRIYRATNPLFTADTTNRIGVSADTSYADLNILSLTDSRQYYAIRASNEPPVLLAKSGQHEYPLVAPPIASAASESSRPEIGTSMNPKPHRHKNQK
jgi:hypothetical protein